jgi:hypothetical protein
MICPDLLGHEQVVETGRIWDLTIFCLAFLSQFSLKLLISGIKDGIEFAYFFELILESLGLLHPLNCHIQELVFVLGMLNHCLHQKRVNF